MVAAVTSLLAFSKVPVRSTLRGFLSTIKSASSNLAVGLTMDFRYFLFFFGRHIGAFVDRIIRSHPAFTVHVFTSKKNCLKESHCLITLMPDHGNDF